MRMHVWLSTGTSFVFQGNDGWAGHNYYFVNQGTWRIVAGNFDGNPEGRYGIAAMHDYGGGAMRIHVWLSTGNSFNYQGDMGWANQTLYWPQFVIGRMVAGDFNGDGRYDIAAMYDYGGNTQRIHVWLSTGTSFTYQSQFGWISQSQYDPNRVTRRMIAGRFDNNNTSDIAAFYSYGTNAPHRIHVWLSTGSSFNYQGSLGWGLI